MGVGPAKFIGSTNWNGQTEPKIDGFAMRTVSDVGTTTDLPKCHAFGGVV